MSDVQLSVIIPVYNVENYLNACLQSVAAQSVNNIEVIIINDGSTDGSLKIAQKFAEENSNFKLITQENKGLSAARNRGLETAVGEYIAFLDSDDFIDPNMYQSLLDIAHQSKSDMVKCGSVVFNDESKEIIRIKDDFQSFQRIDAINLRFRKYLKRHIDISVWSGIYHKSLFKQIRFPEGVCYEDHYVTPKLLSLAKSLIFVPDLYVYYRQRSGAITSSFSPTKRIQKLASLNALFNQLKAQGIQKELSKEFTDYFFYTLVNYHNSMIYNAPKLLKKNKYSFVNIIDKEVLDFIIAKNHLCRQESLFFRIMIISHFLYHSAYKINRVMEILKLKNPLADKVTSSAKNLDRVVEKHRRYINIYSH